MPTYWEIPLKVGQPQALTITLGSDTYGLTVKWFDLAGVWVVDIADVDGNVLVAGIPLVTGADLLAQYRHLGFTGGLWVGTDGDPAALPTFANLGDTAHLYWVQ